LRAVNVTAALLEGEGLADALLQTRREVGDTQRELVAVRNAPPTVAEQRAKITAQIAAWSQEGTPVRSPDGSLQMADQMLFAGSGQPLVAPMLSATRLLCWLFRDEMLEALLAGLGEGSDEGLSAAERKQRTAELEARIRRLEHEEEALVTQALDAGLEVHRRPDASGFALLGLTNEKEVAAEAAA
jgi:hypothetical protein